MFKVRVIIEDWQDEDDLITHEVETDVQGETWHESIHTFANAMDTAVTLAYGYRPGYVIAPTVAGKVAE